MVGKFLEMDARNCKFLLSFFHPRWLLIVGVPYFVLASNALA